MEKALFMGECMICWPTEGTIRVTKEQTVQKNLVMNAIIMYTRVYYLRIGLHYFQKRTAKLQQQKEKEAEKRFSKRQRELEKEEQLIAKPASNIKEKL